MLCAAAAEEFWLTHTCTLADPDAKVNAEGEGETYRTRQIITSEKENKEDEYWRDKKGDSGTEEEESLSV